MIRQFEQSRPQCQQMPREVPAVNGRNVQRRQWFQGVCVVPVEKVTAVSFQSFHCAERVGRAIDESSGGNGPEVVRAQVRQQRKPHVGRRCAVGCHCDGVFLMVIRRKPMIFRADECLEKRPSFPGKLSQESNLVRRQARFATDARQTDPPCDGRGSEPESQYGRCDEQYGRVRRRKDNRRGRGNERREPHLPARGDEAGVAVADRGSRWIPLEQLLVRHQHSPTGSKHRIKAEVGFVRQTRKRECGRNKLPEGRTHDGREVLSGRHISGLLKHIQDRGYQGRRQDDADHSEGPEPS